jgi:pyruvate dehydrogenase E2 component (dihydrolipoamide acetyltransferase)
MKEGKLLSWLVEEQSDINKGDELADVETEKIASAVEAPFSGKLRKLVGKVDTVYSVGALLAVAADDSVTDDEIDAFIAKYEAEFVPEEDDGEESDPSEYVKVNGLNIRYVSKGEGDEVVILIHGLGGDLDNWLFNHDVLVEKSGKRVIALDLPGHGKSSKSVGDGSLGFFADTVQAFMQQLDFKQAHLIGHSMGAALSMQMAEKFPAMVLSLGLICPAGLGKKINTDYINGFIHGSSRKDMKPILQMLFADKELVTRQLINNVLQYKRLDGVTAALEVVAAAFLDGSEQRQLFNQLLSTDKKICVIKGGQDQVIPADSSEIPAGINQTVIASAGHMAQMEAAGEVNDLLVKQLLS